VGQNSEFWYVKIHGIYRNHSALKGKISRSIAILFASTDFEYQKVVKYPLKGRICGVYSGDYPEY
jgi:hypothetical protein